MKTTLLEIYKDLDAVTDKISTQVRTITVGTLAMTWLFLSHDKSAPSLSATTHVVQLMCIATLCVLTLLEDLLQYQAGYFSSRNTQLAAERTGEAETSYKSNSFSYRARIFFFWAKQTTSIAAAVWLIVLLVVSIAP